MEYRYYTVDVFTREIFGGNQLAVFPDGRGLTSSRMQQIAKEFNFSETVFVLPPDNPANTRKVRIFTPESELPFAGHPTVGTAFLLAAIGEVKLVDDSAEIILEEGVGPVRVIISGRDGKPVSSQLSAARMPEFGPPAPSNDLLAQALSIDESDILTGDYSPEAVSCGLPFLFVPLKDLDSVRRSRVNMAVWDEEIARYWAPQVFIFSRETEMHGSDIHARMFAPTQNVPEDPATGSAAAALAGYLARREKLSDGTLRWVVEQGIEMGRPSILRVEADIRNSKVTAIRVAGESVLVSEGTMFVPA